MDGVDPSDARRLCGSDVEVDDDRFLTATDENAFERVVLARVDFLVNDVRRNEDEVARTRFGCEFEPFAPTHAGATAHDVDYALEFAVMVCAGFRTRIDRDGARP